VPNVEAISDNYDHENSHQNIHDEIAAVAELHQASFLMKVFNFLKMTLLLWAFIHTWNWTVAQREVEIHTVHELAKAGVINITFHHDRLNSNDSYNSGQSFDMSSGRMSSEEDIQASAAPFLEKLEIVYTDETNTTVVL